MCRLEDLVAQDDIVSILTNLIDSDNLPHLLLYGPPGTGKTSTIVAAAKRVSEDPGAAELWKNPDTNVGGRTEKETWIDLVRTRRCANVRLAGQEGSAGRLLVSTAARPS